MQKNRSSLPSEGHLVEFYDCEHLENLISLLCDRFTGVTYVYFSHANEPDRWDKEMLERLISRRFGFVPQFLEIPENSMECALEHLRKLTVSGESYVFDITGGSSVFIAAAGALRKEAGGRNIALHEYDTAAGLRTFHCPAGESSDACTDSATLSVEETLALRGITLLNREASAFSERDRQMLHKELRRHWEAVRSDLRAWNAFCSVTANVSRENGFIQVEKRVTSHQIRNFRIILDALEKAGIISHRNEQALNNRVCFSYRLQMPHSAYFLHEKAGNLLEILTYLALSENPAFADCRTGVKLDWDKQSSHAVFNPFNEIDGVATMGYIPCFISCKNTSVENEYLYEIMTMTRHFGGRYAIPALVTSMPCNRATITRAAEMGIVLVDNVQKMSADEFSRVLVSRLQHFHQKNCR